MPLTPYGGRPIPRVEAVLTIRIAATCGVTLRGDDRAGRQVRRRADGAGNWYPDFIAVETDGTHWIVEVKADNELESKDVRSKRQAAKRWANHVSADPSLGVKWRYLLYLLVSESQIQTAKGSRAALKAHE